MTKQEAEKLYNALLTCSTRGEMFKAVRKAMLKRGHWKNKPRGSWVSDGESGFIVGRRRQQD